LRDHGNSEGFTRKRLSILLEEFAPELTAAAGKDEPVDALFKLLGSPLDHREVLAGPLRRLALAYLTQARQNGKPCDPVATFHLSNGARLEKINSFGNVRPYGLQASFGLTVNYRYLPADLEENHERYVRHGQIQVSPGLYREHRIVEQAWHAIGRTSRRKSD
jgi:malonyl-CoA decarboxylase